MPTTNFPDGVTSYGVPLIGSGPVFTTGNVFFVGSTVTGAADEASAGTIERPFATIDYAIGMCTANNGDFIIAMPGHTETVTAAAGVVFDVAGVTLLGIGDGGDTPVITFTTAATADVDIDAASVTIENIHFVAGFADVAAAVDVNADDCTIRRCRFTESAADLNFLIAIIGGTANQSDRLTVEECYALMPDASTTHFISLPAAQDGCIIRNNDIQGNFDTAAIGDNIAVTYVTITDNYINNIGTTADTGILVAATATGMIMNNRVGIALAADATTGIVVGDCAACENYVVDSGEERQGVLDPVAT